MNEAVDKPRLHLHETNEANDAVAWPSDNDFAPTYADPFLHERDEWHHIARTYRDYKDYGEVVESDLHHK